MLSVFAGLAASRLLPLMRPDELMLDEWMLALALQHEPVIWPSTALSLFEQSAPWGVLVLFKALISGFGFSLVALRAPVAIASLLGLWFLWRAARGVLERPAAVFALAIAGLTSVSLSYAPMFKQYSFEFASSAMILWAAVAMARGRLSLRSVGVFAGVSLLALLFSATAPMATAACGAGVLAEAARRRQLDRAGLWRFGIAGSIYLALTAGWYLLAFRPATAFQFSGYADIYAAGRLHFEAGSISRFFGLFTSLIRFPNVPAAQSLAWALYGLVGLAGGLITWRRAGGDILPSVSAVVLVAGLATASAAGVAPVIYHRHVLFTLPILALGLGAGAQAWLGLTAPRAGALRTAGSALALGAAVFVSAAAVQQSRHLASEQVASVLTRGAPKCARVWSYYGALPAALAFQQQHPAMRLAGVIAYQSSNDGWLTRVRAGFDAYADQQVTALSAEPQVCILIAHARTEERRKLLTRLDKEFSCTLGERATGAELLNCRRRMR